MLILEIMILHISSNLLFLENNILQYLLLLLYII